MNQQQQKIISFKITKTRILVTVAVQSILLTEATIRLLKPNKIEREKESERQREK